MDDNENMPGEDEHLDWFLALRLQQSRVKKRASLKLKKRARTARLNPAALGLEEEGDIQYNHALPEDDADLEGREKPPYQPHDLSEIETVESAIVEGRQPLMGAKLRDPIAALGTFAMLPAEIREMVFRNLLVHQGDIRVLRGWSLIYPRSRPRLDTALMCTCRAFYRQGVRILYGENSFVYLLRDPSEDHQDTDLVVQHVYDSARLPIDRHGHLLRNIRVVVEANRMRLFDLRQNLPMALQKFLPDRIGIAGNLRIPAQLHTVTIQLPAQTRVALGMRQETGAPPHSVPAAEWFREDSNVLRALMRINCQFIRIVATDKDGETYEAIVDRRSHFKQMGTAEGRYDVWATDVDMLRTRHGDSVRSRGRLMSLYYWLGRLVEDPETAVTSGPFKYHFRAQLDEPLEALLSGTSNNSTNRSSAIRAQGYSVPNIFASYFGDDMNDTNYPSSDDGLADEYRGVSNDDDDDDDDDDE
ncbi:hypothetical protein BX600DRAFT_553805 [Xylariales sp. PMI_506]|nr:hypothetical protein BX600DRAFT_553805 [Xylariales sp. PMI_506]